MDDICSAVYLIKVLSDSEEEEEYGKEVQVALTKCQTSATQYELPMDAVTSSEQIQGRLNDLIPFLDFRLPLHSDDDIPCRVIVVEVDDIALYGEDLLPPMARLFPATVAINILETRLSDESVAIMHMVRQRLSQLHFRTPLCWFSMSDDASYFGLPGQYVQAASLPNFSGCFCGMPSTKGLWWLPCAHAPGTRVPEHAFHKPCLLRWVAKSSHRFTCPTCRCAFTLAV